MSDDDDARLTMDYTPPSAWWSEEVQQVVEGAVLAPEAEPEAEPEWMAEARWKAAPPLPEPAGPTREQAAQRLVVIAALEQLAKRLKAEHREHAAGVYDRPHMKDPVHLAGRELGQARTDAVKGGWRVADAAAWATYVSKVYEDGMVEQVTTVVDPELTKRALAGLASGDWVTLDPATGEELEGPPPGLEYVPAGHKLVVTPAKDAAVQVAHLLGPVAGQLGLPELEAE